MNGFNVTRGGAVRGLMFGTLLMAGLAAANEPRTLAPPAAETPSAEVPAVLKTSRFEKEIVAFEEQDRMRPPKTGGIVFTGSSSARLWPIAKSFPDLPVVNRGFGGSTYAELLPVATRFLPIQKPKVVVLYSGDNDIANNQTPEQVHAAFHQFHVWFRKELPEARLIVLSIKPSGSRWAKLDKIRAANGLIAKECAESPNCTWIDVGTALLAADGKPRPEYYRMDQLHLTEQGYAVWDRLLRPHLDAALHASEPSPPVQESATSAIIKKLIATSQAGS